MTHLKDRNFCTPIIDQAAIDAKKKKELDEEVERVKKEYEERKKKKEEEKKKKEEEEKEKEKSKDDKGKEKEKEKEKDKDKDKDKESSEGDKKNDKSDDSKVSAATLSVVDLASLTRRTLSRPGLRRQQQKNLVSLLFTGRSAVELSPASYLIASS